MDTPDKNSKHYVGKDKPNIRYIIEPDDWPGRLYSLKEARIELADEADNLPESPEQADLDQTHNNEYKE